MFPTPAAQRLSVRPQPPAWRPRAMLAALTLGLAASQAHGQTQATAVSQGQSRTAAPPACTAVAWPQWSDFVKYFVQDDGRVIDASTRQRMTTSEGQSYAMFFALVANDRATFQKLWRWSVLNLAAADIAHHLPAWAWGQLDNGSWGVLDTNSASDADLWFTYALLEAGRLWHEPDYTRDAMALLKQIEAREIAELPGLGPMLLPAPQGFVEAGTQWRLNPSYMPIPVLRRLAQASPKGPWILVATNTVRLIQFITPKGYAADWVAYRSLPAAPGQQTSGLGQFIPDPMHGVKGSYDAIRTYLWAGMTPAGDPAAQTLQAALHGLADATALAGAPPESVQADSGATQGTGPFGFSAALLPYLQARGNDVLLSSQLERVRAGLAASVTPDNLAARQPSYYDYVLSLFGTGWFEQRYRFGDAGRVSLEWEKKCP